MICGVPCNMDDLYLFVFLPPLLTALSVTPYKMAEIRPDTCTLVVCFTSYFVFSIAFPPRSPGVVY